MAERALSHRAETNLGYPAAAPKVRRSGRDVLVNYWSVIPRRSQISAAEPGPSHWFAVYVSAKYKNHRGMLALGAVTDHDWARINAREHLGLNAKDGAVKLERDGKKVSASCSRHGSLLHSVETVITDRAADSLSGWRETGYGAFVYHYRPNPDWPNGLLSEESVELWKVAGNDGGYPAESPRASTPQVCDISQTRFEWGSPSVSDPYSEFPVREFVGASYRELTSADAASWQERAERPETVFLQAVPKEAFQSWALLNYDRPQKDAGKKSAKEGNSSSIVAARISGQVDGGRAGGVPVKQRNGLAVSQHGRLPDCRERNDSRGGLAATVCTGLAARSARAGFARGVKRSLVSALS